MKKLFVILSVMLLVSCGKKVSHDITEEMQLPKGLSDCSTFLMYHQDGESFVVVRCPNSSTATSQTVKEVVPVPY